MNTRKKRATRSSLELRSDVSVTKSKVSQKTPQKDTAKVEIPLLQIKTQESIADSLQASVEFFYPWEDMGEHLGLGDMGPRQLTRNELMLLDYRKFLAARTIQRFARGWYARVIYHRKLKAISLIQRVWRVFYKSIADYKKLEQAVQDEIEGYFFRAAQMIQALWRGWWVREYIHDHYRLSQKQINNAEQLLHCIAFKLHHLLRTHQIPGVYSLRKSHCLSKVETLLAAMSFKQHNDRVRLARAQRDSRISDGKKIFKNSVYATEIPYVGPNFKGLCEPKCCEFYEQTDADLKMYRILSMYERATNTDPRVTEIRRRSTKTKILPVKPAPRKPDFCADIVSSMRRWSIVDEKKLTVDRNILRNPENLERFVTEIASMYSLMQQERCVCRVKTNELETAMATSHFA